MNEVNHVMDVGEVTEVRSSSALFSFKGRIGTGTFWKIAFFNLIGVVLGVVAATKTIDVEQAAGFAYAARILVYAVGLWLGLATQVKRWHDIGKSGWMAILNCIPGINIFAFLYLGFKDGTQGPNEFGEGPSDIKLL